MFLFLTTNITPLSSMEMQRPKPKKIENKPLLFPQHPYVITITKNPYLSNTLHDQVSQQTSRQAVQSDWQILDQIMNASYQETEHIYAHPTSIEKLQTSYKQSNISIEQKEKKALLCANSLRPDETTMGLLHKKAARIFAHVYSYHSENQSRYGQKSQHKKLVRLITHMNNARDGGIHEDIMGQFIYNNKGKSIVYHGNGKETDLNLFSSLFFILLKKYNLTVRTTGEQLPLHFNVKKTYLNEVLTVSPDTNQQHNVANNDFVTYPAFFQLLCDLRHAFQEVPAESINSFLTYVYGNNPLLQDYSQSIYTDLKNEFYAKAYDLLLNNGNIQELYDLMKMIDTAKNKKDITNEDDLAQGILGFEPKQPIKAFFFSLLDENHCVINVKKHVALFCILARQYNNGRGDKTTPTIPQYHINVVQDDLDIPSDSPFFDKNFYALREFMQLIKGTELLQAADEDEIDAEFNKYYPQKKDSTV